jgi:hypothetical protein
MLSSIKASLAQPERLEWGGEKQRKISLACSS